jgi:hypothetical protein
MAEMGKTVNRGMAGLAYRKMEAIEPPLANVWSSRKPANVNFFLEKNGQHGTLIITSRSIYEYWGAFFSSTQDPCLHPGGRERVWPGNHFAVLQRLFAEPAGPPGSRRERQSIGGDELRCAVVHRLKS